MTDRAPSRRPMMFSRLASAASSPAPARASPRKRTPPGPKVPLPLSCSAPSWVRQCELRGAGVGARRPTGSGGSCPACRASSGATRRRAARGRPGRRRASGPAPTRPSGPARPGAPRRRAAACSRACPGRRARRSATGRPSPGGARASAPMRPKPGLTCSATVPFRQQAWRAVSSRPRPRRRQRPFEAAGQRRSRRGCRGPPVSTATALPDQTVPRASASSSRWPVARATALASQPPARTRPAPAAAPTTMPADRPAPAAPRGLVPGDLGEGRFAPAGGRRRVEAQRLRLRRLSVSWRAPAGRRSRVPL